MRANHKTRAYLLGLAAILTCATARAQDVFIVTCKDTTVSQITASQLRDIFTGTRSRFDDGTRAIPVLLKGGPAHEVFLNKHVGDSPEEFRSRWRKAVFTGQGSMLKEFASEAALLDYIAVTPGAIGYVSRASQDSVKVLTVSP
jgi:ABC-type phosphate transport system substrate-binding protein